MSPLLSMFFGAPIDPAEDVVISRASVESLSNHLARGGIDLLLDVRTPEEFGTGHLEDAVNIPLTDLPQCVGSLSPYRGRDIWLVCRTGMRAERAARFLARRGFRPVQVEGGLRALSERVQAA